MNGWRPISVMYQPQTVASQPAKVIAASSWRKRRGKACASQRERRYSQTPPQLASSISTPTPTMMRKAKKSGATGGWSRNSFRPLTSPSTEWVRTRLPSLGIAISK